MIKILCSIVLAVSLVGCARQYPKDQEFKALLGSKHAEFSKFVTMLDEDSQINRIAPSFVSYYNPGFKLQEHRLASYQALFSEISPCKSISAWRDEEGVYVFYCWDDGLPLETRSKGLAYFKSPPRSKVWSIVQELDHRPPGSEEAHFIAPIDEHWFLYYR